MQTIGVLFNVKEYSKYIWTEQIIVSFIIVAFLCVFAFLLGKKVDKVKPDDKPPKIVMVFELLASIINGFVKSIIGKRWRSYAPYLFTIALFLACSNLSGLLGVVPPTASWNVTIGLALISFTMIHYTGIKSKGLWKYIKTVYFATFFLLFPINLVGELAFPLSLSLRLYGNILSGAVLSKMIYGLISGMGLAGWVIVLIMPVFHILFDVLFGLMQVFVFILLTVIFVGQKVDESELENN